MQTPISFEAAYEVASTGKVTLKAIANAIGCTERQLRILRQENPDFDRTLAQAREDGFMALADSLLTIFEDHPGADAHTIKVKSENIKWYLGCLHRRVFGQHVDIAVTERIDIRAAMLESKARLRVVNPPLIENDSPFD